MTDQRRRMLIVATHPVQYQSPVFRQMAQDPLLDIQVAYCSLQGAEAGTDPEFGIEVKWDVPVLEGYPWILVRNNSLRPGLDRFCGLFNLGLWKLIRSKSYDAVVAYTGYAFASFWIVAAASKAARVPLLFGTDATSLEPRAGGERWKIRIKKVLLPAIFRMATVVIAPSSATAAYLQSLGITGDRVVVTPFVVDNDYWTNQATRVDRAAVRASWGCTNGQPVVLFCAKLQPWKRPQDVLHAFAKSGLPDARLVMAGDGSMRNQLRAQAIHLRIADRVKFIGFVNQSQLPSLYRSADVMVLPSEYDPCPAVVCEAMLCGCPVILSDKIRGRFDLVRPGQTGFVYPCGDVDALAQTLRCALMDRDKLNQLSQAARERMQLWSPKENVQAVICAIDRALSLSDRTLGPAA